MKINLAHVAISVKNLDVSENFYNKNFGFTRSEHYQITSDNNFTITLLENGPIVLELFSFNKSNPLPESEKALTTSLETIGVKHFAFYVDSIEDVQRLLESNNVRFENEISVFENGDRYLFIKDPDGILVEIMEKKK